MITDIEMRALSDLMDRCEEPVAKSVVTVVQNMFGELDAAAFKSEEEKSDFIVDYADEINRVVESMTASSSDKKRMIGDYEVLNSFSYGDKEVFLGEQKNASNPTERFVCGICTFDGLLERYEECVCSDSYNEIAETYAKKMNAQVQYVKDALDKFPYDRTVIGKDSCDSIANRNLEGEIVVINPDVIKPEYVGADKQLCVAKFGNGCSPDGHGVKVFCKNIFTGQDVTWYRQDILGTIKSECIPEWVKERITDKPLEVLFTFGSSEEYPFQWGYVSITAPSLELAISEFRRNYPDRHEGTVNCCDWYYKEDSVAEIKAHGNGAGCHRSIDITIQPKGKSVDDIISKATATSEEVNKDVAQKNFVEIEKE